MRGGERLLRAGSGREEAASRKKPPRLIPWLLLAAFVTGLCLVLYPSVSNYVNALHQTREIAAYTEEAEGLEEAVCARLLEEARAYNASLRERADPYTLTEEQKKQYPRMLQVSDAGAFGYIEIPSLSVTLPLYHGTGDAVLQKAAGHLDWTSLPVGGENTHSVLSGHRGLPSSKLFTDLDRLAEGDVFVLRILHETLTYEVDRIRIVEPEDVTALQIEEGKDLCTLLTCTPYGINTHRLLVRGHRVENRADAAPLISEAVQIEPLAVAPFLAVPLLLLLFFYVWFGGRGRKKADGRTEPPWQSHRAEQKSLSRQGGMYAKGKKHDHGAAAQPAVRPGPGTGAGVCGGGHRPGQGRDADD